jgi:hypothetical protein
VSKRLALLGVLVLCTVLAEAPAALAAIPGPVASWGLDEGAGTTTADATAGGLTGTINGPVWTTSGSSAARCPSTASTTS